VMFDTIGYTNNTRQITFINPKITTNFYFNV
jgi:hypothetical protein